MRALRLIVASALAFAFAACAKPSNPAAADGAATTASTTAPTPTASAAPTTAASATIPVVAMPANASQLAKNANLFAFDLWRVAASHGDNFAASPASISAALAMTEGGARGETARQMKAVLHQSDQQTADLGTLFQALQNPSRALKLRVANRLFGDKAFHFEQNFLDKTRERFGAALEPVDFVGAHEAARLHINAWVEEQTEHKIKDLLPQDVVSESTEIVLVNAIYFLAEWTSPFDKLSTHEEPFKPTATSSKNVQTMHQTMRFPWMQADGVSMLELPYQGDAAMWIVLPDKVDGLADVEKGISPSKLDAWKAALSTELVAVALPRFEIRTEDPIRLAPSLKSLGMKLAFDSAQADLTGIGGSANPKRPLYISDALHKAFVKVDEKGTEAAAATAVLAGGGGAPPKNFKSFQADHPFLFFIVDKPTGLVLFMGRVTNPA